MCVWYGIFVLQKVEYINTFITFELKLCEGIECHFTVDWFVVNRSEWECSWYRKIPAEWIKKKGELFYSDLNCKVCVLFSAFGGLPGISIVVSHTFPPTPHKVSQGSQPCTQTITNHPIMHTLQLILRIRTGV